MGKRGGSVDEHPLELTDPAAAEVLGLAMIYAGDLGLRSTKESALEQERIEGKARSSRKTDGLDREPLVPLLLNGLEHVGPSSSVESESTGSRSRTEDERLVLDLEDARLGVLLDAEEAGEVREDEKPLALFQ